jgi:cytochrome b6-f complex iron-sulfur subunit
MKNFPEDGPENATQNERRRFLQTAAVAAGGLVLGLQSVPRADEPSTPNASTPNAGNETLLALSPKLLETVGASEVIETEADKIIVARSGPAEIIACSAICTHKGCIVNYEHDNKQFVCPCHGSRFDLSGHVTHGPAKRDLQKYQTRLLLGASAPAKA